MLEPCCNCFLCLQDQYNVDHFNWNRINEFGFTYDHPEWNPDEGSDFARPDERPGWDVVTETWQGKGNPLKIQFRNDAVLWYRTIFPKHSRWLEAWSAPRDKPNLFNAFMSEVFPKQKALLIKVFLALADGLISVDGLGQHHRWDCLPIVAALSHGGRVHFKTDRQEVSEPYQFFRWLTAVHHPIEALGYDSHPPTKFYLFDRRRSSHKVKWKDEPPEEVRYRKQYDRLARKEKWGVPVEGKKKLGDGNNQIATNLPFGGLGSCTPRDEGEIVGPSGIPFDTEKKKLLGVREKRQHGHMLVRPEDGRDWGSLLIGVESCEYNTRNHFGHKHSLLSALKPGGKAVTGGAKLEGVRNAALGVVREPRKIKFKKQYKRLAKKREMPQIKDLHPKKLDGMVVIIDGKRFERLKAAYDFFQGCCEFRQRELLRKLLPCTQPQAQELLAQVVRRQEYQNWDEAEKAAIGDCLNARRGGALPNSREFMGCDAPG
jgi:hypothetical protein